MTPLAAVGPSVLSFFDRLPEASPRAAAVVAALRRCGPAVAFGGLPRDLVAGAAVSDIDIVVDSPAAAVGEAVAAFEPARNRFGGWRIEAEPWAIDCWALERTAAFRSIGLDRPTFADLVRTTFFDRDAIAVRLDTGDVFAGDGWSAALTGRTADLVFADNPHPEGAASRIEALAAEGIRISPALSAYAAAIRGKRHGH